MIENELNARLQHAVIGEGSTTTLSTPKKGEIIFNDTLTNFRVGDGTNDYASLSDFISGGSTGDTTYKFKLNNSWTNGSDQTNGLDLSELGSGAAVTSGIYAPTSGTTSTSGATAANQLLLSVGATSAPTWSTFSLTSSDKGVLRFNGSTWTLTQLQSASTNNYDYPILTRSGIYGSSTDKDSSYYSSKAFLNHYNGDFTLVTDYNKIKLSPDNTTSPFKLSIWNDVTEQYVDVQNKLITSNGLIPSPNTVGQYLRYTANSSTPFEWQPPLTVRQNYYDSSDFYSILLSDDVTVTSANKDAATKYAPGLRGKGGELMLENSSSVTPGFVMLSASSTYPIRAFTGTYPNGQIVPNKIITTSGTISTGSSDVNKVLKYNGTSAPQFSWTTLPTVPNVADYNNDNPGLLQVAATVEPTETYINDKYITAIPVFYTGDSVDNNTTFVYKEATSEFDKDGYDESEEKFIGHYVNLYDVISGLIKNAPLLSVLRDALNKIPQ